MNEEVLKAFLVVVVLIVLIVWIERCSWDKVRVNGAYPKKWQQKAI